MTHKDTHEITLVTQRFRPIVLASWSKSIDARKAIKLQHGVLSIIQRLAQETEIKIIQPQTKPQPIRNNLHSQDIPLVTVHPIDPQHPQKILLFRQGETAKTLHQLVKTTVRAITETNRYRQEE